MQMDAKLFREREYFNKLDNHGSRAGAQKFYTIVRSSRALYEGLLHSYCPGKDVLEYGCGKGGQAFDLAERGASVTGIDISDVRIAEARDQIQPPGAGNPTFRVMNAEALEYTDSSFDVICGGAILHHLDLARAYAEVARTLKPDGIAIFIEPLGHNPFINLYRKLTPQMRTEDEHPLRMEDIRMAQDYFAEVNIRFFHLHSMIAVPLRSMPGFRQLVNALELVDQMLFRVLPPVRKYAWWAVLVLSQPRRAFAK
jgi:SAM-dependent methyltransferase